MDANILKNIHTKNSKLDDEYHPKIFRCINVLNSSQMNTQFHLIDWKVEAQ